MNMRLKFVFFLFIVLFLFFNTSPAAAKTAFLSWDAVADPDLIGYMVHYGTKSRNYTVHVDVGNTTNYELPDIPSGKTRFFAVTAYGPGKIESSYSDELVAYVDFDKQVLSLVNSDDRSDQTGWWYDPGMNGTGISIEVQGKRLFMAWYFYDEQTGEPVWLSSGGAMTDAFHYSGSLLRWNGYPPDKGYAPPKSETAGTVEIRFSSGNDAELIWTIGPSSGSVALSRFMDKIAAGVRDNPGLHGWWYDPSHEGMGVFVEIKGGVLFTAWYNYRTDGSPRWWSSGGAFDFNTTSYQGPLQEWAGGLYPGSDGENQTEPVPQPIGSFSIDFLNDEEAYLTWEGGEFHLTRFKF